MMSPVEAVGFKKCVMACFDIPEFVSNWQRLREKSIHTKSGLRLFIKDVRSTVWERLDIEARRALCKGGVA